MVQILNAGDSKEEREKPSRPIPRRFCRSTA